MIVNQNPFEGLVKVIITLVVLGAVMGLLVTGTEWYQGLKAGGEAQNLSQESEGPDVFLQAGSQNSANPQQALALAEAAEQKKNDEAYRQQRRAQDLKLRPALLLVLVTAAGLGILLVAGAVAAAILRAGQRSQSVPARVNDPWKSPAYIAAQIELARRREEQTRLAASAPAANPYRRLRIPARGDRSRLN